MDEPVFPRPVRSTNDYPYIYVGPREHHRRHRSPAPAPWYGQPSAAERDASNPVLVGMRNFEAVREQQRRDRLDAAEAAIDGAVFFEVAGLLAVTVARALTRLLRRL